jgi:hypothetical protein
MVFIFLRYAIPETGVGPNRCNNRAFRYGQVSESTLGSAQFCINNASIARDKKVKIHILSASASISDFSIRVNGVSRRQAHWPLLENLRMRPISCF